MPAFSPTDAFKEASGFSREFGAWNFDQFKQALMRAQAANQKGDWLTDFVTQYLLNNQDAPPPEEIAAMGERIMPGLGAALTKRQQNLQQINDQFGDVRGRTGDVTSRIQDNLNGQAGDIVRTGDTSQDILNNYYSTGIGRAEGTNADVTGQMQGAFGKAQQGTNDTFGSLRAENSQTGNALIDSLNGNYNRSRDLSSGTTRDLIGSAGKTFADLQGGRNATFGNLHGVSDSTLGGQEGEARGIYGNLTGTAADTFRNLQGDTTGTYGKLADTGGKSFDESMAETEALKPAGLQQQSRVARNFAPVVANAKQRLRASGVNENDAQAISQLADLEAKRASAMDDAAAASTADYIGRRADIRSAKQADAERLGTSRLNTTIDLGKSGLANNQQLQQALMEATQRLGLTKLMNGQQLDLSKLDQDQQMALNQELNKQGLSLNDVSKQISLNENENARGTGIAQDELAKEIALGTGQSDRVNALETGLSDRYAAQQKATMQNLQGLDYQKAQGDIGLQDTQFNRTQQWRQQGDQAAQLQRAMEQQDWQTAANILNQDSQEQLTALDLKNMAYTKGNQYVTDAFNRKNAMMGNLQGMAGTEYAKAAQENNTANQYGGAAAKSYTQTYNQEAGKGGWGTGLLAGLTGGVINAFAPGAGTAVAGAINGAGGNNSRPVNSGSGYGTGNSSGNPFVFNWLNPQQQQQQFRYVNIDNPDLYAGG